MVPRGEASREVDLRERNLMTDPVGAHPISGAHPHWAVAAE